MRAAVVTDFRSPLQIQDVAIPEPGPGEVLVRIEDSGLCHTDIHAAHGDWPVKATPPFIPGHEGIGIIERLGTGVTSRKVGERVAIAWLGYACGECSYCIGGREALCEKQRNSGYGVDGAFAEYAVVAAAFAMLGPRRCFSARRGPVDLRRRDHVQGDQGRRCPTGRDRGNFRCWRPRAPGPAVRPDRRRLHHRGRRRGQQACDGVRTRRRPCRQRGDDGPGRGDPGPRRRGRRSRARRVVGVVRPGVPVAATWRSSGLRRAAGR